MYIYVYIYAESMDLMTHVQHVNTYLHIYICCTSETQQPMQHVPRVLTRTRVCIYVFMYMYTYMYICIRTYRESKRGILMTHLELTNCRVILLFCSGEAQQSLASAAYIVYMNIYIYIYVYRHVYTCSICIYMFLF